MIAHKIESMILEGQIGAGERLKENYLSREFGVSQTTIRESLRMLESRGFVRHFPNKGTFIISLTGDDLAQLTEARLILETEALRLAKERASPQEKKRLYELLSLLATSSQEKDLFKYHEAHMNFHSYLWLISHNNYLADSLRRLVFPLWAFYQQIMYNRKAQGLSGNRTHEPIVHYITGLSSGQSAEQIIKKHIEDVSTVLFACQLHDASERFCTNEAQKRREVTT
jgi:DNA-binding GntR family transcriptional regulator